MNAQNSLKIYATKIRSLFQDAIFRKHISSSFKCAFPVLDSLYRTPIDTAGALKAFSSPNWLSIHDGNGFCGAVFGAQSTGNAGVCDIKRLCRAGEVLEPIVHEAGFEPGQFSLFHISFGLMPGNLL